MAKRINVILGTMGIPNPMDAKTTTAALKMFRAAGYRDIDTAIMYQLGKTEKTLGDLGVCELDSDGEPKFNVATKVNPWMRGTLPRGGLTPTHVEAQLTQSLASLKTESVPLLYLHAPDHETPIEDTLAAMNEHYRLGRFKEWGLSNYASWEVADIVHICRSNGYPLPTVYQGMYNCITREVEPELFPGGILAGRYKIDDKPTSGRFNMNTVWGAQYRVRYWNEGVFKAVDTVSMRWLAQHSKLEASRGDGVIVGASSLAHLDANLRPFAADAALPDAVLRAVDAAWDTARTHAPEYFR